LEDEELASLEKPITGRSPEKGHLTEQNLMDTLSEDGSHMIDAIRELERWMSQRPLERPENHSVRISSEPEDGSRMIDAIRELERWMSQGPLERSENHSVRISSEPEDGSHMIDAIRESYWFREDLTPELFEMIRKNFSLNDSETFALSRLRRHFMIDAIRELERCTSQRPWGRPENHSIRISSESEDGSHMIDAIRESYWFREDLTPELFEMTR
jgi:phosphotransferase system HPr-like phosphotransfer protein